MNNGIKIKADRLDKPVAASLDYGDTIEFSLSHQVRFPDRTEMWVKFGATTKVRDDETSEGAASRLSEYVMNNIKSQILTAVAHADTIA